MSIYHPKFKTFGIFTDQILQYANETFSVLHARFLKQIWGDNRTTAKLHHNQVHTDWQNGTYEAYIPTRANPGFNLQYLRVAIQVLPEIGESTKRAHAYKLANRQVEPLGEVESELLILVAYKQDKPGIVKGFKHRDKCGYFTAVMVSRVRSPELIWKRVLDHLGNFIQKRLDGLMASLGFETWVWKWMQNKNDNCSTMERILERFSYSLRQSAFTFLRLHRFIRDRMIALLREIGNANVAKQAVEPVLELSDERKIEVLKRIKFEIEESLGKRAMVYSLHDEGLRFLKAREVYANG